jgi:hypothetical protein
MITTTLHEETMWPVHAHAWHTVKMPGMLTVTSYEWLVDHVGAHGVVWIYPEVHLICFRSHDHAIQFSLIWGGV